MRRVGNRVRWITDDGDVLVEYDVDTPTVAFGIPQRFYSRVELVELREAIDAALAEVPE